MADNWRCRLFWGNPRTEPPHGQPRIIMAILCEKPHPIPDAILEKMREDEYKPGSGWSIGWECIEQRPIKRWSPEARARVRQNNLRRRMEKKYPLFAEDFIAAEMNKRPRYFQGDYDQP